MKIIILTENPKKLKTVYPRKVTDKLRTFGDTETVTLKSDILSGKHTDTDYIFSTWGMPHFTLEEIKTFLPNLKAVFYAAGSVQGFAREFLESGIRVFSAWGANSVPVADFTLSEILLSNKGTFRLMHMANRGDMPLARKIRNEYPGNYGTKIGLLGIGMIGSLVAKRLREYDFEVLAFDPFCSDSKADSLSVRLTSLEEIFRSCSVVSNHLANNEKTVGILKYEHFSSMPKNATFINTGRGAQTVEEDLAKVLGERPDLTALLDVTYPEPPEPTHPFYSLPNCFLTPHIAGSMGDEHKRMAEWMVKEFELLLSGKTPDFEVTLKMLETMA